MTVISAFYANYFGYTFLQLFVMKMQNRHDDRMKWYKLTGIGASRDVEFRSIKHIVKIFFSFLSKALRNGFHSFFSIAGAILNVGIVLSIGNNEYFYKMMLLLSMALSILQP
jgi:hypothetical protein